MMMIEQIAHNGLVFEMIVIIKMKRFIMKEAIYFDNVFISRQLFFINPIKEEKCQIMKINKFLKIHLKLPQTKRIIYRKRCIQLNCSRGYKIRFRKQNNQELVLSQLMLFHTFLITKNQIINETIKLAQISKVVITYKKVLLQNRIQQFKHHQEQSMGVVVIKKEISQRSIILLLKHLEDTYCRRKKE
ncbi:unnamed protein product (macronuclear) [Paramecium tetraurelia]|uniref:Transmembrane protein n=1 Tax=Paramecium tetraurelia TaxID=5888 RepID=A0BKL7_PARTE|nr:uncharacterized protein GSPATT00029715001 [Paramecium tetraurelia]CAK59084.1 unnamed protein product [Paramecium tetraurelia]|eukprot:XP_001426482.1 hypothetical protein (macronuclear) [Paramecium tetraurelia strain d4-2]